MKIVMISPTARAGTPQYCHNLANALGDAGHDVLLVTSVGYEFPKVSRRYDVIEVIDRLRVRLEYVQRFRSAVRVFKPDIVQFVGAQHPGIYLGLSFVVRAMTSAPFVYTPLDVYTNKARSYEKRVFRRLYARMGHVFANTAHQQGLIRDLFAVPADRVTVSPIPDLTSFLHEHRAKDAPGTPGSVLCFGLIQPRKGIAVLIDAFAQVVKEVPGAHLHIVGRADAGVDGYRDQIMQLKLLDHVTLRDEYVSFEEMGTCFETAQLVVLPYLVGWTSGVLASAFGFGRPVVATDVGAMTDVVISERNGLIVPPGDADALAAAIVRVLSDDDLRQALAEGALAAADDLSWEAVARDAVAVFANLLAAAKAGRR